MRRRTLQGGSTVQLGVMAFGHGENARITVLEHGDQVTESHGFRRLAGGS